MERHCVQARKDGVVVQPPQRQLIARRENRERSGIPLPLGSETGEGKRELQGRVRDLTGLNGEREISAGNQVQLVSRGTLAMRHISMIGRMRQAALLAHRRARGCLLLQ